MKTLLFFIVMTTLHAMAFSASANSLSLPKPEETRANLAEFAKTFDLTSEQHQEMVKIIDSSTRKRDRLLKKFRISLESSRKVRLNFREKHELLTTMKKISDNQEYQLSRVLNEDQMSSWKSIIKDIQEAFKERLFNIIG
ncbi:hypothetical protein FLL45_18605 [Aliikangiella marina]|uniref:Uncharacterized protein n=1 Tax=Aliikangiella marina TaxID=1712262 RepID=A0A545T4R5_9GAMM|nr:hypothetical protein [Aliikangiella marina]TQV72230.1 hypothetical protein FLL45_18605 [Aliikangiella marina]